MGHSTGGLLTGSVVERIQEREKGADGENVGVLIEDHGDEQWLAMIDLLEWMQTGLGRVNGFGLMNAAQPLILRGHHHRMKGGKKTRNSTQRFRRDSTESTGLKRLRTCLAKAFVCMPVPLVLRTAFVPGSKDLQPEGREQGNPSPGGGRGGSFAT